MKATDVALDSEAFVDAKEVLMEEYDMDEEEAERRRETILTDIMLEAQEAGRDWERDEYMAVTDVLMGIQRQQQKQIEQMEESRLATVARYLPTTLLLTATIQVFAITVFMLEGFMLALLVASILSIIVLVGSNLFLS